MTNLLVDIGNTRLKWSRSGGDGLTSEKPIAHGDGDYKQQLLSVWREITPAPRRLAVSCVSSEAVLAVVKQVAAKLWPGAEWLRARSQAETGGVINGYRYPEKLGVDRWLCLLAARRLYQEAVCIVDCGTAITVDIMTEQGRHLGGVIGPGLIVMKRSLSLETEALPLSERVFPVGLADTTEAAIYSGTLLAAVGMIETLLSRQKRMPKLILTGGDAEVVARHLNPDSVVAPELVLQGLAIMLEN